MCGRFAQVIKHDQLKKLTDELKIRESSEQLEINYNVAPTQTVSAVVSQADFRCWGFFRWGLVPSWMKAMPDKALINVRSETILEKPSFKVSFIRRRCVVPANGFYEWRTGDKQPFFVHSAVQDMIYMAGIYDAWYGADGSYVPSLGIITTSANVYMQPIHSRMPLLLSSKNWDSWLDPQNQNPKDLMHLLEPDNNITLNIYPVDRYVNSTANNSEKCMQAAEIEPKQSDIFL